jgi:hypothetical protein
MLLQDAKELAEVLSPGISDFDLTLLIVELEVVIRW